jgi:N6-adenosine-specific RNA methylase IME4
MFIVGKKYSVVYADPPWRYAFSKSHSRKIENQYPTMKTEEIMELNVPTEKNAVCYLWATAPKLLDALSVLKSWGFSYVTHMVWDKKIQGM